MIRNILLSALFVVMVVGCKKVEEPQMIAERALIAYLRCSLPDIEQKAQPQVVEQLRWRLSNMSKEETQQMLNTEPKVNIEESTIEGDTCRVILSASDVLLLGDIGQNANVGKQRFAIILVKDTENTSWHIAVIEAL